MAFLYLGWALGVVVYMILGMLWYSNFFGKYWIQVTKIKKVKMTFLHFLVPFILGVTYSFGLNYLFLFFNFPNYLGVLMFAIFISVCFSLPPIASAAFWERTKYKGQLFLINFGFFFVYSIIVSSLIYFL